MNKCDCYFGYCWNKLLNHLRIAIPRKFLTDEISYRLRGRIKFFCYLFRYVAEGKKNWENLNIK